MIKNKIIYNSASNYQFDILKATGSYIWDSKGNKMLDFTSGWNVTNLGWNNKEILKAMSDQIKKSTYAPMETADNIQNELARSLVQILPKELVAVGRTTGGMESNEEAIKTAYAYTKRKKILGFKHMYHGQSISMMTISLDKNELLNTGPIFPGIVTMDFPKSTGNQNGDKEILQKFSSDLETKLRNEDIAAVITESGIVTGWGSTYIAPKGFLTIIRRLTKKYGTLLIVDEVGTGMSRCGELFGMNLENVSPDIATFAKGFSNGAAAIGAMVTTKDIAEKTWELTNLQSTFGWSLIACAAVLKIIEINKRDKVWIKSRKDGEYIRATLNRELKDLEDFGEVRGLGMEIGLSFSKSSEVKQSEIDVALKVVENAKKKGLYVLYGDDANIQLMPSLLMSRVDLNKGLDILIDSVRSLHR